jgi:hypothetical protein
VLREKIGRAWGSVGGERGRKSVRVRGKEKKLKKKQMNKTKGIKLKELKNKAILSTMAQ